MTQILSMSELLKMTPAEVQKELKQKRAAIAKTRLALELGKEKNSATLRLDRQAVARLLTALSMQRHGNVAAQVTTKKSTSQTSKKSVQRPRSKKA